MKDNQVIFTVAGAGILLILLIFVNNNIMANNGDVAGSATNYAAANNTSSAANNSNYVKPEIDVDAIEVDRLAGGELVIDTLKEGNGEVVEEGDTVEVHYSGVLTDGTPFDNSYDRGSTFSFQVGAGMVIAGWDQGLVGAKVGEQRLLLIPSELGYGSRGAGGVIGPDADLVFVVDVVSIR